MTDYLTLAVPPSYDGVRQLRQRLQESLEGLTEDTETTQKILLCCSEILTNFVEHSQKIERIGICLKAYKHQFELILEEQSAIHSEQALRDWIASSSNPLELETHDPLRTGGRGALLVGSQADQVEVIESTPVRSSVQGMWRNGMVLRWRHAQRSYPLQILVVEDEKALNALYCTYLSGSFTPIAASSVDEAVGILATRKIDLIFSDLKLAEQSSLALREYMAEQAGLADIPFILTSAYDLEDIKKCIHQGIDDFLPKPVKKETLIKSIERSVARYGQLKHDIQNKIYGKISGSLQEVVPQELAGWTFACRRHVNQHGGGDLIFWQQQGESVLMVIADVMGHDEAAKFFAHAYLGYMRGLLCSFDQLPNPEVFLQRLSQAMYQDRLLASSFCTVCAILLQPGGRISIANAGHPPPIKITRESCVDMHEVGMLPGLQPDIVYTSSSACLEPGERIALFTDGIFDEHQSLTRPSEAQQKEQLKQVLQHQFSQPLDEASSCVFEAINGLRDPDDDALVLLIEACT